MIALLKQQVSMTFLWSECECMSVWLSRFSILVFPIIPWGARWYSDLHSPRWVLVLFRTWLLLKSAELKTFPRGVLNRKCQNSTILSCIGASAQVYMFTLSEGNTVGNKTHLFGSFIFYLYFMWGSWAAILWIVVWGYLDVKLLGH